jgi:hypothetical protein
MPGTVVWIDRETFAYSLGNEKVLVWVDYEPGLFSKDRVIHSESVRHWVSTAGNVIRDVTEAERTAIVQAVADHLRSKKATVRVTEHEG